MNEHDHPIQDAPPQSLPQLQALDLAALRGLAASLDGLVCDIDDPDCELPGAVSPTEADRRRTEVLDGPPDADG